MALPPTLQVALKEWNVVCDALNTGRQMLLLRKGGIQEAAGGFVLEHPQFLFFPTYLHQNVQMLKPAEAVGVEPRTEEPASLRISLAAEVTDIIQLKSREQMQRLDAEHIWSDALIDMRFNYRPWNPLYLLLVRAFRLSLPGEVVNTPAYAGCKSWVPLETPIACDGAVPTLDDERYAASRALILRTISSVNER
jgi:hypothetical protein